MLVVYTGQNVPKLVGTILTISREYNLWHIKQLGLYFPYLYKTSDAQLFRSEAEKMLQICIVAAWSQENIHLC